MTWTIRVSGTGLGPLVGYESMSGCVPIRMNWMRSANLSVAEHFVRVALKPLAKKHIEPIHADFDETFASSCS